MNIRIPHYDIVQTDQAASIDMQQDLVAALRHKIMSRFMYEPMDGETSAAIKDYAEQAARGLGVSVRSVEIDDMRDLDSKAKECRACAEASSYEEYLVKRAALNLPDEAGSEKNWRGMSRYTPGAVDLHVCFDAPDERRNIECSFLKTDG